MNLGAELEDCHIKYGKELSREDINDAFYYALKVYSSGGAVLKAREIMETAIELKVPIEEAKLVVWDMVQLRASLRKS